MIITDYRKLSFYSEVPFAEEIVSFIDEFKKSDMKPGRYDIHGDDLFAAVSRYDTEPAEVRQFENHRKYIDLQIVLDGSEKLLWADVGSLTMTKDGFSDGGDISFYEGEPAAGVILSGDTCAVLFETDAHMPNVINREKESVLKIVFKIKK